MPSSEIEQILDDVCNAQEQILGYLMTNSAGTEVIATRGMVAELQHVTAMVGVLNAIAGSLCEVTKTGDHDQITLAFGTNGMRIVPVGIGGLLLVHHHGRDISEDCASAVNRAVLDCARHL